MFVKLAKRGVGGTVDSESALRSAGTLLLRVRAPPSAPRPDGGPESLRSPCCGLAIQTNNQSTEKMEVSSEISLEVEKVRADSAPFFAAVWLTSTHFLQSWPQSRPFEKIYSFVGSLCPLS
ncbi:hypothetical protein PoB_002811500 [Plakobranchus ocellatus]|uniref:Uncharacterized protein n=1 Tax=Plakobranchus ocellatus TaxID=259542 RepID=A0AAV4A2I4_9GAST|nr:hypothetical protein PoB_002811500 [Plakobranchus ocellatus]